MIKYKCTICKKQKPLTDFHKKKRMKFGHSQRCKECHSDYNKSFFAVRKGLGYRADYFKKYRNNNILKISAKVKVRSALHNGTLVRMPCEVCNAIKTEAHHDDYNKPLNVRWLCHKHHMQHHFRIKSGAGGVTGSQGECESVKPE